TVAAAGVGGEAQGDKLVVDLGGRVKPGAYTAMVALSLGDALENAEVTAVPLRVAARSDATGSSARAALTARLSATGGSSTHRARHPPPRSGLRPRRGSRRSSERCGAATRRSRRR